MVQSKRGRQAFRVLVVLTLLLSFLVRFSRFDYPLSHTFKWGDGTRDFLVAEHILKFREYPLVGPYNLLAAYGIYSSPLYFYFLALFLAIYDNILFLSLLNIFLQIVVLVLIFLCVKKVFGEESALVAILLYSFVPEIIKQADFVWQPFLMQPLSLLSLLTLIYGYFNRSKKLLYFSLILLLLATVLHNSALPWMPLFLGLIIFFLWKKAFKFHIIAISTIVVVALLLLHLPVLIFYFKAGLNPLQHLHCQSNCLFISSLANYFANLNYNLNQFFDTFSINHWFVYPIMVLLIVFSFKNRLLFLTFLLMILPILFSSFFNKNQLHYIGLSLPIFPVFISVLIVKFFPKISHPNFLKIITVVLLLILFSSNLMFLFERKPIFQNFMLINEAVSKVEEDLWLVKQNENFTDWDFFQVITFSHSNLRTDQPSFHYPVLDTILLAPLEKKLNRKLINLDDLNGYNHIQKNQDKYIILVCMEYIEASKIDDCSHPFLKDYPNFYFVKKVFTRYPLEIDLMAKMS